MRRNVPHWVFLIALAAIAAMGWSLYDASSSARESSRFVNRLHEVLEALASIEEQVGRAESGVRGYVVSRNASFLLERDAALTSLRDKLQDLDTFVSDLPEQKTRARTLAKLVDKRLGLMQETVRQHETGAVETAAKLVRDAQQTSSAIFDLTREMQQEARALLASGLEEQERRYQRTMLLLALAALLGVGLVVPMYVMFIRQTRELHEAKLAADAASTAKSSFLAVMSHEIRTPLNGILGMLELLSLSELDADQRTTVNVVRESGRSLQRIIDDILDFSKIEAGKLEIAMEPASIRQAVESTRNIYAGNASSKGLLLTASVDPQISPALVFDPLRLRQILNNLTSNAIKFTSDGEIELKAELVSRDATTETVRLSVKDSGIGMPEAVQSRLFEPFVQASAGTARTFGGTGLGLAISRRLTEMMGGKVEVSSVPDKGTTMIVTLPLAIADPAALPESGAAAPPQVAAALTPVRTAPSVQQAEREGTLVLLADDHPVNRMLLERQVKTLGYAAELAADGRDALEKWKSGRFAIVISDINMPELDGYKLAREIRRIEGERNAARTPLIACTANALKGEAEACLEAGMDDYLAKPVQLAELQKKLDSWLPLPAARPVDAAPASAARAEPVLDREALAMLTGGVAGAETEILCDFRRVNDEDAAALGTAYVAGDLRQVERMAHRIKGASRMVGLTALGNAAERVEHAAKADSRIEVSAHMQALDRELDRVNRYIDASQVGEAV